MSIQMRLILSIFIFAILSGIFCDFGAVYTAIGLASCSIVSFCILLQRYLDGK